MSDKPNIKEVNVPPCQGEFNKTLSQTELRPCSKVKVMFNVKCLKAVQGCFELLGLVKVSF